MRSPDGRFEEMGPLADEIAEIGHREHVADLIAMGVLTQGRLRIYQGEVGRGLALLDEAVTRVLTGGVSPLVAGVVLCTAIDGCQEVGDVDRVSQWADNLRTWCQGQPGLLAFTGAAALHHGQVLVMRGAWEDAEAQLLAATDRYLRSGQKGSAGVATRELGDLFRRRGQLDPAESAYEHAAALGCDPQPGLALLWLARGSVRAAEAAVHRTLDEAGPTARRGAILPAAIEIALAAQDLLCAEGLVREADALARMTGSACLEAVAARANALLEIARGDPAAAVPYARRAISRWVDVGAPYEVAVSRVALAAALDRVGDHESARRERDRAERACRTLGAVVPAVSATHGSTVLSARELEVLRLVATGASNREVARRLTLSERTVARHLSNIFTKLDVTSRTAAARFAHEHDLTPPAGL